MEKRNKKINSENQQIRQKIAESLNLSHLTKAQQEKIISGLMDVVSSKITTAVFGKLTPKDKNNLKKISTSGSGKVLDFINKKTENFPKLVEELTKETVNDFRKKERK